MVYYYAQINVSNIVVALLETDREIDNPTLISITSFDRSLFGRVHIGGGVFANQE